MKKDQITKGIQTDGAGPVMPDSLAGTGARMGGIHPGLKVALAILAAIFWLAAGQVVPNDHSLSIEIHPGKMVYRTGAYIGLRLTLENTSNHGYLIYGYMASLGFPTGAMPSTLQTISYEIIDPDGTVLSNRCVIDNTLPDVDDFILLEPDANQYYTIAFPSSCYSMDDPGVYSVRACYYNSIDPGYFAASIRQEVSPLDLRQAWKGLVCSNTVQVEVVP